MPVTRQDSAFAVETPDSVRNLDRTPRGYYPPVRHALRRRIEAFEMRYFSLLQIRPVKLFPTDFATHTIVSNFILLYLQSTRCDDRIHTNLRFSGEMLRAKARRRRLGSCFGRSRARYSLEG